MRRLVLFVEGDGEVVAVPSLVRRLQGEAGDWSGTLLDENPFRVGGVNKLVKDDFRDWKRLLAASLKRGNVSAVLLILDGDAEKVGGKPFCAAQVAGSLAKAAVSIGAGKLFSVAIVFARQEYETWLIAGIASMAGKKLPDGRLIQPHAEAPGGDLESSPRNAKGWLDDVIERGYKPTRDQAALTKLVDLEMIRGRGLRSFRRLESAIARLFQAIRDDKPIVSPS